MRHSILADGIFDIDEAFIRIATIVIVPLAIAVIGGAFLVLSKLRKK